MRIEHIAFWVKDLDIMKRFYETYFHASANELYHNKTKSFKSYFFSFDTGCRLEIMPKPSISDAQVPLADEHIGLTHFAVSVGSKEEVNQLTERIRKDGYTS